MTVTPVVVLVRVSEAAVLLLLRPFILLLQWWRTLCWGTVGEESLAVVPEGGAWELAAGDTVAEDGTFGTVSRQGNKARDVLKGGRLVWEVLEGARGGEIVLGRARKGDTVPGRTSEGDFVPGEARGHDIV